MMLVPRPMASAPMRSCSMFRIQSRALIFAEEKREREKGKGEGGKGRERASRSGQRERERRRSRGKLQPPAATAWVLQHQKKHQVKPRVELRIQSLEGGEKRNLECSSRESNPERHDHNVKCYHYTT